MQQAIIIIIIITASIITLIIIITSSISTQHQHHVHRTHLRTTDTREHISIHWQPSLLQAGISPDYLFDIVPTATTYGEEFIPRNIETELTYEGLEALS